MDGLTIGDRSFAGHQRRLSSADRSWLLPRNQWGRCQLLEFSDATIGPPSRGPEES